MTDAAGAPARRDFRADDAAIDDFAAWMREELRRAGFAGERATLVEVALVEAFTNIVRHSLAGREDTAATIEITPTPDGVTVLLEDPGPAFDPLSAAKKERRG